MGTPGKIRTRRDVWRMSTVDPWNPDLLWYAKAVAHMQSRPLDNPLGWRYQAAIHGYDATLDPFSLPGESLPPLRAQRLFWSQCQHGSWFFLPWHRMYLHCFERIVARTIEDLGGPADWALPYWNYSDASQAKARHLPPAFIDPTLPDGTPNPLSAPARSPHQSGDFGMQAYEVDLWPALSEPTFVDSTPGTTHGFGGDATGFSHVGHLPGVLEMRPHGDVHSAVAGPNGLMGMFATAALDPIFWLHHANIDRLWTVWRQADPAHTDPSQTPWLNATSVQFDFHDDTGQVVRLTPAQVVDTTVAPLNYRYEDVSNPFPAPGAGGMGTRVAAVSKQPAELVGALPGVRLGTTPTTTSIALKQPTGPARRTAQSTGPLRVYLNFENITADHASGSYVVSIQPAGASPASAEVVAGTLPMFGVVEATRTASPQGGSGLTYALDITDIVASLEARDAWDPSQLRVKVEPIREVPANSNLKIGRISVFYR